MFDEADGLSRIAYQAAKPASSFYKESVPWAPFGAVATPLQLQTVLFQLPKRAGESLNFGYSPEPSCQDIAPR